MTEKIEDGGWMPSAWPGLAGLPSDDAHDQATPQLKAYCSSCGISPASFRACIEHGTGKPYEDLCCDNCDSVIASVEGRTQAPQWLPAESAPMDGTEFLSLNTNQGNLRAVTWYSKAHGYFCATGGQHLYQFTHWLAIESAVLAKIATTPAASPIPIDARRRTLLNSLATLRESKHLSMDGHSYLIDAVQKAFATREKTEPSPDFIEAVSCFRKAAWERDHPEMMRWQLRIMELVREGEA